MHQTRDRRKRDFKVDQQSTKSAGHWSITEHIESCTMFSLTFVAGVDDDDRGHVQIHQMKAEEKRRQVCAYASNVDALPADVPEQPESPACLLAPHLVLLE